MKSTSNIEAYVEWFNRLSYLVATEICVVSLIVIIDNDIIMIINE